MVRKPSGWPSFGIQLSRCPMDSESQLPQLLRCIRDSCQAPDAFVVLACILSEMWAGERLGNWPLQE